MKKLKKNDTVAIVSTARKITLEELKPAINWLETIGLNVKIGNTIGLEENQFAGTIKQRAKDFQECLDDNFIDAIWCARGGFGTVQIIDLLDFTNFIENPKLIIGYSDITVLHSHLHNLNCLSIHATMPINITTNSSESLESLKNDLFGLKNYYQIKNHQLNKNGITQGKIVGGNLSIIYSLLGSETSVNTDDKILFIEDLDEYLYHIERMMINLKRNNYLKNLKGLIVGGMTKMNDNKIKYGKSAEQIINDLCVEYDFPIAFGCLFGHLDDNRSLYLGKYISLDVNENASTIKFL